MLKNSQRGEIATIVTLGTLLILGISTIVSSVFLNKNTAQTTNTRAAEGNYLGPCVEYPPIASKDTPAGYHWKANCAKQCNDNGACPTSSDGKVNAASSNWCYGFTGPKNSKEDWRCMMLQFGNSPGASQIPTNTPVPSGSTNPGGNTGTSNQTFACGGLNADGKQNLAGQIDCACCDPKKQNQCPSGQSCIIGNGGCKGQFSCGVPSTSSNNQTSSAGTTDTPNTDTVEGTVPATTTGVTNLDCKEGDTGIIVANKTTICKPTTSNRYWTCVNGELTEYKCATNQICSQGKCVAIPTQVVPTSAAPKVTDFTSCMAVYQDGVYCNNTYPTSSGATTVTQKPTATTITGTTSTIPVTDYESCLKVYDVGTCANEFPQITTAIPPTATPTPPPVVVSETGAVSKPGTIILENISSVELTEVSLFVQGVPLIKNETLPHGTNTLGDLGSQCWPWEKTFNTKKGVYIIYKKAGSIKASKSVEAGCNNQTIITLH